MLYVDKGTTPHHNLSLLHKVLWPDEVIPEEGEGSLEIFTFHHWDGKKEECWVRFVRGEQFHTYWLNSHWTRVLTGQERLRRLEDHVLHDLRRPRFELPADWLKPADTHPEDTVTQEEYRAMDTLIEKLRGKINNNLAEITRKSNRFIEAARSRDHELYMSFNIVGPDKNQFALRYDKVYPKLPAEGYQLGQGSKLEIDIHPEDKLTQTVFNRIKILERTINKDILRYRTVGQFGEAATQLFNKEVRSILFAATHFSKRLYPVDTEACKPELERVANEILTTLNKVRSTGRDVALDVNSWIVWEYQPDTAPVKCEEPELDFKEIYLEGYIESFTSILMGYLMDLQVHQCIRPYHHLVKADASDGIAVGTIRQVK